MHKPGHTDNPRGNNKDKAHCFLSQHHIACPAQPFVRVKKFKVLASYDSLA